MVASEHRKQCVAITKKGTRCKLYALPGEKVCHVHINKQQTSNDRPHKQSPDKRVEKPGNIYVFTYAHMMYTRPTQTQYLNLAEPTDNNWIDYNKTAPFDPSDKILIKVGFTRKKPEARIKEWREQCRHSEFILLYPGCLVPIYKPEKEKKTMRKLEKLFKNLKIASKDKELHNQSVMSEGEHTGRRYKNLNQEHTCFVSSSPYQSEQNIHKILRDRYGSGKMFCEGCAHHKINADNLMVRTVGVHTEWFMVPRNEMGVIWDIIETECNLYGSILLS